MFFSAQMPMHCSYYILSIFKYKKGTLPKKLRKFAKIRVLLKKTAGVV
jgi:hypothetical protein